MAGREREGRAHGGGCGRGKSRLYLRHRGASCAGDLDRHAVSAAAAFQAIDTSIVVVGAVVQGFGAGRHVAEGSRDDGECEV